MRVAVVGAGWAGMAAAVALTQAGHHVTVMEAARTLLCCASSSDPCSLVGMIQIKKSN